jgi:hypothetical protein
MRHTNSRIMADFFFPDNPVPLLKTAEGGYDSDRKKKDFFLI